MSIRMSPCCSVAERYRCAASGQVSAVDIWRTGARPRRHWQRGFFLRASRRHLSNGPARRYDNIGCRKGVSEPKRRPANEPIRPPREAIERQWKEDNPYFKVTSPNHSYFGDMGMPKLLKSVEKVDDYTIKVTLDRPEAPFLADLAMPFAAIQSKEYADA